MEVRQGQLPELKPRSVVTGLLVSADRIESRGPRDMRQMRLGTGSHQAHEGNEAKETTNGRVRFDTA